MTGSDSFPKTKDSELKDSVGREPFIFRFAKLHALPLIRILINILRALNKNVFKKTN
jgi:hypothetical protein